MIERVEVRGFQSLKKLDLVLGRLTVIVGPSSSGKTALMRAFRSLASNLRGSAAITRGAKSLAISVHTGEHVVTLERSETAGTYRLTTLRPGEPAAEQVFTKLAGAVPEQITTALRIMPVPSGGGSINFASQFDRPYLLDDSGAAVARVLGELTNVNTILEAVREANRQRSAAASTLRTREVDLVDAATRMEAFATLPARLHACATAEVFAARAARVEDRITQLRSAIQSVVDAATVLARSEVIPEPPSGDALNAAQERLSVFRSLVRDWIEASNHALTLEGLIDYHIAQEAELHDEWHAALVAAGTCPTCQRPIEDAPKPPADTSWLVMGETF